MYKGLGNAMNYLKDHLIYYNDWLGRNFAFFTRLITFEKFWWITTTQEDMTGDGHSLTLITVMI